MSFFVLLMGFNVFYCISRMQGRVNICICRGEHFAFFMFINEAPGGKQTKAFITQQLNQKQLQPSGVSRNNQNLSSNTHQYRSRCLPKTIILFASVSPLVNSTSDSRYNM